MVVGVEMLLAAAGAALIVLVQFDLIATVFHPQIESPLSNHFHRLTWRFFAASRRFVGNAERLHAALSWGMPLMVAGVIALWLLLLLVGFACVYFPWIGDPAHFAGAPGSGGAAANALYFSGVMLTTVGLSDLHPVSWPFRLLGVVEAASGFVVVSLSVAYLLGIYPALSRKRAAAIALDAEVAGQAGALPMVRRYLGQGGSLWQEDLTARLRELSLELLTMTENHETYPVLYYAHDRRVQHSFLRILVTVQSLVGLLRYGLSPDRHSAIVYNPQLLLLEQSLHYSLRRLTDSLHSPTVEQQDDAADRRRSAGEYDGLCAELEAIGLVSSRSQARTPVPAIVDDDADGYADVGKSGRPAAGARRPKDPGGGAVALHDPALDWSAASPLDAYLAFRQATDPHINAYAITCGYLPEEARGDTETMWWAESR